MTPEQTLNELRGVIELLELDLYQAPEQWMQDQIREDLRLLENAADAIESLLHHVETLKANV